MSALTRRQTLLAAAGAFALPFAAGPRFTPAEAAAPLQGVSRPQHFRFKLGEFEVTTVLDGSMQPPDPFKIYGIDQKPEDVTALAEKNFLPGDKFDNGFTPVILNTGNEVAIFDTGNGAARRPNAGRLKDLLPAAGFTPDQVDVVVITHFHPDHIGGLMEDGKPLFPNARYVMGETEFQYWTSPDRMSGPTQNAAKVVEANIKPVAEKTTFVKGGADVVTGVRAVAAPGHTPGHTAYHVESAGKRLLVAGDFCNHYVLSLQRPEWHVSFDTDKDQAAATRKTLLDMLATERIPYTSYHTPFPAVGFVDRTTDGFRFVPVSYQLFL